MFRVIRLAIIFLAGPGSMGAVELVGTPRVELGRSSVTLRWTTDSECGARVRFGPAPGPLVQTAGGEGVGTVHAVTLDGLKPGTNYVFSVGTARKPLATGNFTTAGTKPAPVERKAPAAARIWGNPASLRDHFERHGRDFRAKTPDDYARQSWEFLQRAIDEGLPAKVDDSDGTIRVWDPKTRAFAAYNRDGTTRTYFKPGSPDYFERQPGRLTKLKRKE